MPRLVRKSFTRRSYSPSSGSVGARPCRRRFPGHSVDMPVLRRILAHAVDEGGGLGIAIPDGHVADSSGRLQIPFEQHR